MTPRKQRLTVTVDPELIQAGNRAVAAGDADSMSGWVGTALSDKVRRDQKLEKLGAAISDYEAEFGEIRAEEIRVQGRVDREDALVVRGGARMQLVRAGPDLAAAAAAARRSRRDPGA